MGILYVDDSEAGTDSNTQSNIYDKMISDGITPLKAYSFLLFVLLYFPCLATIAAIKNETGTWKWAVFVALYTTGVAWIVSAAVYQIGCLLI